MSPIDVIIGADLFGMLVIDSVRKGSENESTEQNTTLGWILSGLIASSFVNGSTSVSAASRRDPRNSQFRSSSFLGDRRDSSEIKGLRNFNVRSISATHYRMSHGRYVVRLSFKSDPPISLGECRVTALQASNAWSNAFSENPIKLLNTAIFSLNMSSSATWSKFRRKKSPLHRDIIYHIMPSYVTAVQLPASAYILMHHAKWLIAHH